MHTRIKHKDYTPTRIVIRVCRNHIPTHLSRLVHRQSSRTASTRHLFMSTPWRARGRLCSLRRRPRTSPRSRSASRRRRRPAIVLALSMCSSSSRSGVYRWAFRGWGFSGSSRVTKSPQIRPIRMPMDPSDTEMLAIRIRGSRAELSAKNRKHDPKGQPRLGPGPCRNAPSPHRSTPDQVGEQVLASARATVAARNRQFEAADRLRGWTATLGDLPGEASGALCTEVFGDPQG